MGVEIPIRSVCVMRGIRIPLVVLWMSNAEKGYGVVVPIPTCPFNVCNPNKRNMISLLPVKSG